MTRVTSALVLVAVITAARTRGPLASEKDLPTAVIAMFSETAKAETSAAAAFAWLADPQPPPPPLDPHQQIAREIADALAAQLEDTTAAITELHTYSNEEYTDA